MSYKNSSAPAAPMLTRLRRESMPPNSDFLCLPLCSISKPSRMPNPFGRADGPRKRPLARRLTPPALILRALRASAVNTLSS